MRPSGWWLALGLCACGGATRGTNAGRPGFEAGADGSPMQALFPFPPRETLDGLPEAPPIPPLPEGARLVTAEWTVDPAALPVALDPGVASAEDLARLAGAASAAVANSAAARCAASEIARFAVEREGLPSQSVAFFIAARCGLAAEAIAYAGIGHPSPWREDRDLIRHSVDRLREALPPLVSGGARRREIGIGVARGQQGALVVAVSATLRAELSGERWMPDAASDVSISGTLLEPADELYAFVNVGASDVRPCALERFVFPDFSVRCRMEPGDAITWIDLGSRRFGHVLVQDVARVLVVRDPNAPSTYRPPPSGGVARSDPAAFARDAVLALNRTRAERGRPPIALSEPQARSVQRVAARLFADPFGPEVERLSLYAAAGWDVGGEVVEGSLLALFLPPDVNEPASWLSYALERPMGRMTLLGPHASIALGVAPSSFAGHAGVLVTTHGFYDERAADAHARRVFDALSLARTSRGGRAPRFVPSIPTVRDQVRRLRAGAASVDGVLSRSVQAMSRALGRSVRANAYVTMSLDLVPPGFDDVVLDRTGVFGIEVTAVRPEGGPWVQYVVFVYVVD